MYVEILHDVVAIYLAQEGDKKSPITIELTPFIYKTLQFELNDICSFRTEVPIESAKFESLVFMGRSVKIMNGKELNDKFEMKMVERLTELAFKVK